MPPDPPGKIQEPQNGTAGRSKQDPTKDAATKPSASAGVQEAQESTTNPIPQQDKPQGVKNAPSASTNLEATQGSITTQKSTAKSKLSTLFGKIVNFPIKHSPIGVLETGAQSLNLGTGMAVKNALIQTFICEDFKDFYHAKGEANSNLAKAKANYYEANSSHVEAKDDEEVAQALQEATQALQEPEETAQAFQEAENEIDKIYIDLKNETGVDLGEVRIYNDSLANELCINQGKLALVCPQGVLLASPYIDYNLLSLSIKTLGNSFGKFKLKGDSTWGLHYLKIQEMLPIFRLVDAASANLFKNFDEGDFFYKLGAGGVNDIKAVFGTSSLEVPNMLTEAYIELVNEAVKDSADGYVLFGTKEKSQNAFAEYFGVPYNPSNIAMANKAIEKMLHIAIPGKTFIDHGTPDWDTWWRDDEDHTEEMKLRNSYLIELEEGLGDAKDDSVVASILQAIKRIKDNENPKKYLEWKDDYNLVYDNVKKLTKNIQDNSEPILTNAYGKYGEFYFDMLWEIAWSKVYAFATETAVSVLVGGGVGVGAAAGKTAAKFVGKKIAQKVGKKAAQEAGKEAAKQGAKEAVKEGTKQAVKQGAKEVAEEGAEEVGKKGVTYILKEAGKRLGREGVENGIMTGVENADAIFGDRKVSGFEALLSWGLGTASGFGLGILGDFATNKIISKHAKARQAKINDKIDSNNATKRVNDEQIANLKKGLDSVEASDSTVKRLTDVKNNVSVQVNAKVAIIESEIKKYVKEIAKYNAWIAKKTKAIERLEIEIKNKKHVKKNRQRMS